MSNKEKQEFIDTPSAHSMRRDYYILGYGALPHYDNTRRGYEAQAYLGVKSDAEERLEASFPGIGKEVWRIGRDPIL